MFVLMLEIVLRYINFQVVLSVLGEISAMIKRNKWNFKEIGFCFVFFFFSRKKALVFGRLS